MRQVTQVLSNETSPKMTGEYMQSSKRITRWREGFVNRAKEHFELCCTDTKEKSDNNCIPVAIVGPPDAGIINVQFLLNTDDKKSAAILHKAKEEIHYYLIELNEADPWKYAQYHCRTASNIYSNVRWSFVKTQEAQ